MNVKLFAFLSGALFCLTAPLTMAANNHAAHSTIALADNDINAASRNDAQPRLNALSVLVLNQDNGQTLYQKNSGVETPIASITKLMTAMVILDAHLPMEETLTISALDIDKLRHTGSRLPVGTKLTRGELLHLALIASENRAAHALARTYPGGRERFIYAMNNKARNLAMQHTAFEDPTGLSSNNRSTAEDLAKLVEAASHYPQIRDITTTGSYEISHPALVRVNGKHKKQWRHVVRRVEFRNTNRLVRDNNWNIGLSKTGFINEAGHCLVMQTKIAQQRVIIVLLDAYGKYARLADAQHIKTWLEHRVTDNSVAALNAPGTLSASSVYVQN